MAAQLSCSFASHSNGTCNLSARFPGKNEFFPHLRQLKIAKHLLFRRKDLILARVGWFLKSGGQ